MPKSDVPRILSAATISSTLFIDLPEMRSNSANKFFDALAAGKPVFLNFGGWMHELVCAEGCGLSVWKLSIEDAAKALDERLHDAEWIYQASASSRRIASQFFDRDLLAFQARRVLESVCAGKLSEVEKIAPGKFGINE